MSARFVTQDRVSNRAAILPFLFLIILFGCLYQTWISVQCNWNYVCVWSGVEWGGVGGDGPADGTADAEI